MVPFQSSGLSQALTSDVAVENLITGQEKEQQKAKWGETFKKTLHETSLSLPTLLSWLFEINHSINYRESLRTKDVLFSHKQRTKQETRKQSNHLKAPEPHD